MSLRGTQAAPEVLGTGPGISLSDYKGVQMSQGDQQWGPDPAEGATSPSQQSPREPCRSHRGGRGQEQGTGAATVTCRSSTWFGEVLFGAGKRKGCPQVLQSPRSWAQEHPHISRHRNFLGICFHKLNSFAAPPFPASSCCLCSLLAAHPAQPHPCPPSQGHTEQDAQSSAPEAPRHQRTPGGPGRQGWHLPAAPGLWISLPSRDSGSFQSHELIEASGGSRRREGAATSLSPTTGRAGQHRNNSNQCFPKNYVQVLAA